MGVDLVDPRTGVEHLYARRTKRGDIVDCGMSGEVVFIDVAALAAAIETAERRKNSTLMRDVQVALPCELDDEQCVALTAEFAELLATRYRTQTAWTVHRADKRGDARNNHGHIILPTRELDDAGGFGKKLRILDEHRTGRIEVAEIRQLWEGTANTHLERAGHDARVYVGRREDGNPVPTLGAGCTALEREAAEDRGEVVENRSVADLVSTGEAVTWRGKALRRHQLRAKQQARQKERASVPADAQEVATIAVATVAPPAPAAPVRVGFEAPPMTPPVNSGLREARSEAVAIPARIDLEQRTVSVRRVLRVAKAQADAVPKPVQPCGPAPSVPIAARARQEAVGRSQARHVQARPQATPQEVALAVLEVPPTIDEMAVELREKHPDVQDWMAVSPRSPGKLQREVVGRAHARAQAESRPVRHTAPSILDRVAAWIRERVDAALQLLGLRRRGGGGYEDQVRLAAAVARKKLPQAMSRIVGGPVLLVSGQMFSRLKERARDGYVRDTISAVEGDESKEANRPVGTDEAAEAREAAVDDHLMNVVRESCASLGTEQQKASSGRSGRRQGRLELPKWDDHMRKETERHESQLLKIFEAACDLVRPQRHVRSIPEAPTSPPEVHVSELPQLQGEKDATAAAAPAEEELRKQYEGLKKRGGLDISFEDFKKIKERQLSKNAGAGVGEKRPARQTGEPRTQERAGRTKTDWDD